MERPSKIGRRAESGWESGLDFSQCFKTNAIVVLRDLILLFHYPIWEEVFQLVKPPSAYYDCPGCF